MSNHVHVLLQAHVAPSELFWPAKSDDHWVRHQQEHERIAAYIENNLVQAGLVKRAEEHRWSSAYQRKRLDTIVETAEGSVRVT